MEYAIVKGENSVLSMHTLHNNEAMLCELLHTFVQYLGYTPHTNSWRKTAFVTALQDALTSTSSSTSSPHQQQQQVRDQLSSTLQIICSICNTVELVVVYCTIVLLCNQPQLLLQHFFKTNNNNHNSDLSNQIANLKQYLVDVTIFLSYCYYGSSGNASLHAIQEQFQVLNMNQEGNSSGDNRTSNKLLDFIM
jgi:hypothetical protein